MQNPHILSVCLSVYKIYIIHTLPVKSLDKLPHSYFAKILFIIYLFYLFIYFIYIQDPKAYILQVAATLFAKSFAHSWHSLQQLHELPPGVLKEFPYMLGWLLFFHSQVQLVHLTVRSNWHHSFFKWFLSFSAIQSQRLLDYILSIHEYKITMEEKSLPLKWNIEVSYEKTRMHLIDQKIK